MKEIGKSLEKSMGMTDAVWEHHANPMSGWSRVPVLPLLALAIWSHTWIGYWSILPIFLTFLWIWLNPRIFPVPASTNNWMSKGVLGERVWLNRKTIPIPLHHSKMATKLNLLTGVGMIPAALGLFQLNFWATAAGVAIMMIAKLWFLDRMVWLYDDMKDNNAKYQSWLR